MHFKDKVNAFQRQRSARQLSTRLAIAFNTAALLLGIQEMVVNMISILITILQQLKTRVFPHLETNFQKALFPGDSGIH